MPGKFTQGSFLLYGLKYFGNSGFQGRLESKNPAHLWEDISGANLSDRSVIITGANSGIGLMCSEWFALHGATVHMLCRNEERGVQAVNHVIEASNNNAKVHFHLVDVSIPASLRKFAKDFDAAGHNVDILVNNAGIMVEEKQKTEDGIESTFATNTLSTFMLTNLMIPALRRSIFSVCHRPIVINVSSGGMLTEPLVIREKYDNQKPKWSGMAAYARTKRHQIALTELYAKKFPDILFVAMHPGWTDTLGVQTSMPGFYESLKSKLRTPEQGADTIFWLAINSDKLPMSDSGEFFRDRRKEIKHFCLAATRYNHKEAEALWNWCAETAGWSDDEFEKNNPKEELSIVDMK